MKKFVCLIIPPIFSLLIILLFVDLGSSANINITNCTQLEDITSSNNYILMQDLDCPLNTQSVDFSNGIFGNKEISEELFQNK